jgi:dihydrofolate reductase/thymidylate synthase
MSLLKIIIIGGSTIYKKCLENDLVTEILLTSYECNNLKFETFLDLDQYLKNFVSTEQNITYENNVKNNITNEIIPKINFKFIKYIRKNEGETAYLNLLDDLIKNGHKKISRSGYVRSIFGKQLVFDNINEQFPLLTTKRTFFRGIVEELLFFLRDEYDSTILEDKKVNIWKGNTRRSFLDKNNLKDFKEGEIGSVYSFTWHHFGADYNGYNKNYTNKGVNQLKYVINLIKNDPTSRRIVLSAWNPPQLHKGCLNPCHIMYIFNVEENKFLNCMMVMRSSDSFLGLPFNIGSTALLTAIIANICNLIPKKSYYHLLIHIYMKIILNKQNYN